MIEKLSALVEKQINEEGVVFSISEQELKTEDVAATDGLLGLFLFRASEIHKEMFQKRLGLAYEKNPEALLDYIPELTGGETFVAWSHALHYAVEEEIKQLKLKKKKINDMLILDDLYQDWFKGMQKQLYPVQVAKPSNSQKK